MSEHKIEVVPVKLEKHPNADTLSIVRVKGYQVIVRTEDWIGQDLGVYVPPDYVMPQIPCVEFLRGVCKVTWGRLKDAEAPNDWMSGYRIKTKKFRGEWSQGLLLPVSAVWEAFNLRKHAELVPPEISQNVRFESGKDVMTMMGIGRYEPKPSEFAKVYGGDEVSPPTIPVPVYDVQSFYDYPDLLVPGETVIVTEKIHGTNARYVYHDGQFYVGSHKTWKKENGASIYWRILRQTPGLEGFLTDHPDTVLFGEIFGDVQDLTYGRRKGSGDVDIRFFDVMSPEGMYEDMYSMDEPIHHAFVEEGLKPVPILARVPYSEQTLKEMSVGKSFLAPEQIREGIVIRPEQPRTDKHIGRVVLKIVSNEYLERQ